MVDGEVRSEYSWSIWYTFWNPFEPVVPPVFTTTVLKARSWIVRRMRTFLGVELSRQALDAVLGGAEEAE